MSKKKENEGKKEPTYGYFNDEEAKEEDTKTSSLNKTTAKPKKTNGKVRIKLVSPDCVSFTRSTNAGNIEYTFIKDNPTDVDKAVLDILKKMKGVEYQEL